MFRFSPLRRAIAESYRREQFHISRLSSGLRVITCDDQSGIIGMGLFTLNGAKFEEAETSGAAAVLESMPLRSNALMPTQEVSERLGILGNAIRVLNNKEALAVLLMVPAYHCKEGLDLLNAMVLHPSLQSPEEFQLAKEKALERTMMSTRDGMSVCLEMLHEAGWDGKGLGNPLNPSAESLEKLSMEQFSSYFHKYTTPSRSVVAATGVADHLAFVKQVEASLSFDDAGSATEAVAVLSGAPYTGGARMEENTAAPESMNKFQEKNLSHVALFFKGIPLSHPDYYTVSVMQTLLGGGTTFSSGGPGKGMHTKIYREVLTREPGVHGMECITAWYSDGGLIGLYGTAEHQHVQRLFKVMLDQSATIAERITDHHLEMAKNQMCSQLILLGEGREQLLSDMGLNLLVHQHVIAPVETAEGAKRVTMADMRRVSNEILKSPPALSVYGSTKPLMKYDEVTAYLQKYVK